jgi:ribose 5-phosphate isomerase B
MAKQKIILAADHAGFDMKEKVKQYLKENDMVFEDLSPEFMESDDYPDACFKAAKKVAKDKALGIFACGSGLGMCICANKVKGIRAAVATDEKTARISRQHNDVNILCLAGREMNEVMNIKVVRSWLTSNFLEGRHARRIDKITAFEKDN